MEYNKTNEILRSISIFLIVTLCYSTPLFAKHYVLNANDKSFTIYKAIQLAKRNDTILLQSGTYPCVALKVDKPLVIIGIGKVILDGKNLDEIVLVYSSNVVLKNLEIHNSNIGSMKDYAGIKVFRSRNVRIQSCKLINCFFGIYLSDSKSCLIQNCSSFGKNYGMSNTGNGIHLWKCDSIAIRNNQMEGHRDGIYFEFAKHCKIIQNKCMKNFRYGLHFMFSDNDTYTSNTFQSNGTGVAVMYSKAIVMTGNRFENNWGDAAYGLLLKDISNSFIHANIVSNNTVGITMEGCSNVWLNANTFKQNGFALRVWANCLNDTFCHNNFISNTFDASTNGELQLDNFDYNYWDKYQGYDLSKDKIGDIPFHPVSIYSMLIQQMPYAVMLLHSFVIDLLDRAEKNVPSLTPAAFVDNYPLIQPYDTSKKY